MYSYNFRRPKTVGSDFPLVTCIHRLLLIGQNKTKIHVEGCGF